MPPVKKVGDNHALVETSKYPDYAHFPFEKFNPVQSRIFDFYNHDCNAIIAAATSAGKAQPIDTLVLTPNGYLPIGKLKVGDLVIGIDGNPVSVVGVFPQGIKDIFKVEFSDKTSTRCCEEHLWNVRSRSDKYRLKNFKTLSLRQIKEKFKKDYWHIPLVQPICFNEQSQQEIHPYALGLLLGDGGFKYGAKLSNSELYCIEKFRSLMPKDIEVICSEQNGIDYRIVSRDGDHFNEITWQLREMCLLGLGTHEKFIPYNYKISTIENRIALLRGLMDSDGGGFSNKSPTFEIVSKELAYDMADLVRSLGGWTHVRVKNRATYKYKGELREGRPVYRLTIVLNDICPFSLPRKVNVWHNRKRDVLRKISTIEKVGKAECVCIKIANEDGLYVTNDFIVTHNTICSEMFMANEVRERGGKAMYLAPLRALAKEKIDDWTDPKHHFSKLNLSICTGDYRLTPARKKELEESNIILMTSEMLNARCRNMNSEHNDWLREIGTLVVDESHLLTVPGRGDHLEVGLMNFAELGLNPRIVFLSATMPNVQQIAEWVSYTLTGKETYLLESTYRPCPLGIHYEPYYNGGYYDDQELEKVNQTMRIIEDNPDDRFLLFVHTKRTGELLKTNLIRAGYDCEFHNADLEKDSRHALEKRFREGKLKYVIATSTLAWGLNLPARRVVILGVHRGLSEVATYDIWQMAGRAGRPGYDPRGDVYILLPESHEEKHRNRLKNHQPIESKLLDHEGGHHKTLAFHLVSEIHHGRIKTKEDVINWYERTLAKFQSKDLDDTILNDTITLLLQRGAIKEENGIYKVTVVGMVSSMFYYSPFDAADLRRNFIELFNSNHQDDNYWLAMALGNVDSIRMGIVSKAEREDFGWFQTKIWQMFGKSTFLEPAIKGGFAYYCALTDSKPGSCATAMRMLQWDFGRLIQVLNGLDSFGCKWGQEGFFKELQDRVVYSVRPELIRFVKLPEIGKVRAERLWSLGFRTLQDVVNKSEVVRSALNMKQERVDEIIQKAKALILVGEN